MTEEERLTSLPSLPFSPVGPLGPSGPVGPGGPGTDFSGWDQRQRQSANGSKIRMNTLGNKLKILNLHAQLYMLNSTISHIKLFKNYEYGKYIMSYIHLLVFACRHLNFGHDMQISLHHGTLVTLYHM